MIEFLDKMSFLFTLVIIILATILLIIFNGKQWVIKNSQIIAVFFAIGQFIAFIAFVITNFLRDLWYFGLLQDLCPTISFLSISIFIWNKENIYKLFMPWLIIGALVTMIGGEAFIFSDPLSWITYFQHTFMLMQGICAYFWIKRYSWQDLWSIIIFPASLIFWLLIGGLTPWQITGDVRWAVFSTALFEPAIGPTTIVTPSTGEVIIVSSWAILGELGIPYPIPTLLFYLIALLGAFLIALNKNYFALYRTKIKKSVFSHFRKRSNVSFKIQKLEIKFLLNDFKNK